MGGVNVVYVEVEVIALVYGKAGLCIGQGFRGHYGHVLDIGPDSHGAYSIDFYYGTLPANLARVVTIHYAGLSKDLILLQARQELCAPY